MLKELTNARQIPGEGRRRWFSDEYFDLIVWYEGDDVSGFQLCYDLNGNQRTFTWHASGKRRHDAVDEGESRAYSPKSSPVLVQDGAFDAKAISARFIKAAVAIPEEIRSLVLEAMRRKPL